MADLITHNWTGFTNGDMTVSSSAVFSTRYAWKVFDNLLSVSNDWLSSAGLPCWWKIDFGETKQVRSILMAMTIEVSRIPKNFTVEGSNNDSDWDTLLTITNDSIYNIDKAREWNLSSYGDYQYYKINITANYGDATYTQIGELYLYDTVLTNNYSTPSGIGYRPWITVSCDLAEWGKRHSLVGGAKTNSYYWSGTQAVADKYLRFDFGEPVTITEAKWYQQLTSGHGTWKWQGSNNGSDWTDIGSSFTLGGVSTQTQTELNGNTSAYRYYQLLGISGDSSQTWLYEIEFGVSDAERYASEFSFGDRSGYITVSSDLTMGAGTLVNLVDGLGTPCATVSNTWINTPDVSGKYIKFDFGEAIALQEAIWTHHAATAHGTWKWQGSANDSDWYDVGSSFTLGGAIATVLTELNGNTTAYRYWRLLGISGSTDTNTWIWEIYFSVYEGASPSLSPTANLYGPLFGPFAGPI